MRTSLSALVLLTSMVTTVNAFADVIGHFDTDSDLFLAHFDSKTDVDDLHSVAGVATILDDNRFSSVDFHAVAGAYGTQEGPYVPANELFDAAFGDRWSDAHADFEQALAEVSAISLPVMQNGGSLWIADAGQSDFSAALIRRLHEKFPGENIKQRVHVVQHADWNEEVTSPSALAYVREQATYHKIPDGNIAGNGTPGFRSSEEIPWRNHVTDPRLAAIWESAIAIADDYNGKDGRYLNEAIRDGGLDFSDVAEVAWIFGFETIEDAAAFFREFTSGNG